MILLVAGVARQKPGTGDFITPKRWSHTPSTPVWAADNGAFGDFQPDRFRTMLDRLASHPVPPKFVAVPDVVGDHARTVDRYLEWSGEVRDRGLPRAFVLQNGVDRMHPQQALPWGSLEALFIGGDTAFKFTAWVRAAIVWAKRCAPEKWIHMGRVNSLRRLNYARLIGCDSCDGSGMARFSRCILDPMLGELSQTQLSLYT